MGGLVGGTKSKAWIPAFAGMTRRFLLEHFAIYLPLVNCKIRKHPGAFHFMQTTLQ
jgi:hypothetical protein